MTKLFLLKDKKIVQGRTLYKKHCSCGCGLFFWSTKDDKPNLWSEEHEFFLKNKKFGRHLRLKKMSMKKKARIRDWVLSSTHVTSFEQAQISNDFKFYKKNSK